jgi:hypothetical protein
LSPVSSHHTAAAFIAMALFTPWFERFAAAAVTLSLVLKSAN